MATIENKKISDFPRNTGTVRVSKWKNKVVVSAKGRQGTVRSTAQLSNSIKFKLLRQFFSPTRTFIALGFANASGRATDRAMKVNFPVAFYGNFPDISLNYPSLLLSNGPLSTPKHISATPDYSNVININWSTSRSDNPDDRLMVVFFNPANRQAIIYTDAALRSDLKAVLPISPTWNKSQCHIYLAFRNPVNSQTSDSVYLGNLTFSFSASHKFDNSKLFSPRKNKKYKTKDPADFSVNGISGKVGPVNLFTKTNDEVIIRANPHKRSKPQTLGELQATKRFSLVSHFLYKLHTFVKQGFSSFSEHTLPHSAAMSANLKNIVIGDWPDYHIDYTKAQLSDGPLTPPRLDNISLDGIALSLSVCNYDPRLSLLIALYCPKLDAALFSTIGTNDDTKDSNFQILADSSIFSTTIEIPSSWCQHTFILFAAFIQPSDTPIKTLASPTTSIQIAPL